MVLESQKVFNILKIVKIFWNLNGPTIYKKIIWLIFVHAFKLLKTFDLNGPSPWFGRSQKACNIGSKPPKFINSKMGQPVLNSIAFNICNLQS